MSQCSLVPYVYVYACVKLDISWITAIIQVTDRFGNVIVKFINIKRFDLLECCHYILNPPRSACPNNRSSQINFEQRKTFYFWPEQYEIILQDFEIRENKSARKNLRRQKPEN